MRILFLGDMCGKSGRTKVYEKLPGLIDKLSLDFVIVNGENAAGLLPGLDGTPTGSATPLAGNECVAADVLGGSWADPGERWGEMLNAIDEWRPDHNTMPSLASHPMRIVGWSTFTLGSDSLDLAHEYAGHAKLHIDISLRALDC